ncbi:MAG: hypothetical protein ACXVH7_11820, partial [Thermoanaerobaculia bacterium]
MRLPCGKWSRLTLALMLFAACGPDRDTSIASLIEPLTPPVLRTGAFTVCWKAIEAPRTLHPAERAEFTVTIRNCSDAIWPDPQMGDPATMMGSHAVRLVHRWRHQGGEPLQPRWERRVDLPWPLLPGRTIELPVRIVAPAVPGDYAIEFDLVQEDVVWFG